MPKPKKIFVLSTKTGPASTADCTTLFQQWFPNSDVKLDDFTSNFSGLSWSDQPIFVVPGGGAVAMLMHLNEQWSHIQDQASGYHLFGACALAYMASDSQVFHNDYKVHYGQLEPPRCTGPLAGGDSLSIFSGVTAYGPFHPDHSYGLRMSYREFTQQQLWAASLRPYSTSVKFTSTGKALKQLFVEGAGFVKTSARCDAEFSAYHVQSPHYDFWLKSDNPWQNPIGYKKRIQSEDFAAMATRKANPDKQRGGVVISCFHPEASVKDSRMLSYFSPENDMGKGVRLTQGGLEEIKRDSEKTNEVMRDIVLAKFGFRND